MKNKAIAYPYVGWMALFVVAPILIITVYAFTSSDWSFTTENFRDMTLYSTAFGRSFLLAAVATVICLLIGYPLAYFLARETGWVHRMATMLIMLPMWMNFLLRTYSWQFLLERNGLINLFFGFFGLGPFQMIDTQGAIVLGMVYDFLPFMVLPIYNTLMKIDDHIIEAAYDLGATKGKVLKDILLPLSIPGIASGVTMVFVPSLTTFVISNMLGGGKIHLIGNIIEQEFTTSSNWNLGSGLSLVMMIFIVISMAALSKLDKNGEGTLI